MAIRNLAAELENFRNVYATHGRRIHKVYDAGHGWKEYPCKTVVPPTSKLMSFDLVFGKKGKRKEERTILCLDNYGNEIMCGKVHKHLMNGLDIFEYLLGIDRQTGEIYCVSFLLEGKKLVVAFCPLVQEVELEVPTEYMKRLDELKCKKRPWFISLPDTALFSFIERYFGYCDLSKNVIVDLEFDNYRIQVSEDMWREISNWK